MKKVGTIGEIDVFEDLWVPDGKMYFLGDNFTAVVSNPDSIYGIKVSRWYRIKRWIKRHVR
jgi:hypothetical protein